MSGRWYRDVYRDAIWECEALSSVEKAVAETYARHARDENDDKSATADVAWLTYERLMAKAGIGRRANVSSAVASLVKAGWLKPVRQVSRRATVYRLTIPAGSSDGGTTGHEDRSSDGGTTVVPPPPAGSSTSSPGSSDGGTQPLGPSRRPSTTSLSPHDDDTSVLVGEVSDRERDDDASLQGHPKTIPHAYVAASGYTGELATEIIDWLSARYDIRSDGWWINAKNNGTLATRIAEAVDDLNGSTATDPSPSAVGEVAVWCGKCSEADRRLASTVEKPHATYHRSDPCPDCHPLAVRNQQPRTRDRPEFPQSPADRAVDAHAKLHRQVLLQEERERDRRRVRGEHVPYRDRVDPADYEWKAPR